MIGFMTRIVFSTVVACFCFMVFSSSHSDPLSRQRVESMTDQVLAYLKAIGQDAVLDIAVSMTQRR